MSLLFTFWICKVVAADLSGTYFGSGMTKAEAEIAGAKACFDDGNVACIVKRCGTEKPEEGRD